MKPIGAGALRTPIFLGKPVVVKDNAGGETLTWAELATWAAFEPLTGREWSSATIAKDSIDCRIVVRLVPGWTPEARWRVRDAVTDALFNIVSALVNGKLGIAECAAKSAQGNTDGR